MKADDLPLKPSDLVGAVYDAALGVVLLNGAGKLMHANSRAHELAAGTLALRFAASGAVVAVTPRATARLQQLIDGSVRTAAGKALSPGGTLQLAGANGALLNVLVTPLPTAASPFGEPGMAALFLTDPRAALNSLSGALKAIYGMTPAEAELTQALASGISLKELAQARYQPTHLRALRQSCIQGLSALGSPEVQLI